MAATKKDDKVLETVRYFKVMPKYGQVYGEGRVVTGFDIGQGTVGEPDWSTGHHIKVVFKIAKDVFRPLAEVEVEIDVDAVASKDVLVASLTALKESLE